jgi:hypothetical protein
VPESIDGTDLELSGDMTLWPRSVAADTGGGLMRRTTRTALAVAMIGSALLVATGIPASASSLPARTSVAASYGCSATTPIGTFSYTGEVTFTGTTPAAVAIGATVAMTGFQATVSVPGSILDEAYSDGVRTVTATVTAFDINATDADTQSVDVVTKPVTVGHTKLAPSGNPSLSVDIPRKPSKVGAWVAGAKGMMSFSPGDATIHFKTNLGSLSVQCSPDPPAPSLSTTTVN